MELIIKSWSDFKSLCVASKILTNQYADIGNAYRLIGPDEHNINWQYDLPKLLDDGSVNPDATDFENNYKASFNQPMIIRAGIGRPERVSVSPQPIGTYNKWKGHQAIMEPGMTYTFVDVSWPTEVYFRGGYCYTNATDADDYVNADVVLAASDQMVMSKMIETAYLSSGILIPFLSDESMAFPPYLKLRVNFYCPNGLSETEVRYFNVLTEYFQ